jgi:20S proteasome alpha/beta subunit
VTLILGIPVKEGIVVASDGQVTRGLVRSQAKKIKKLNENCVWGAAGDFRLFERVEERIAAMPNKEKPLQDLCPVLREIVPKCVEELVSPSQQPSEPGYTIFVFAEYRNNPRILFVRENGDIAWAANLPFAIGNGDTFAYGLLHKYEGLIVEKIDSKLAAVLAYKVIAETAEVISEGVGPPIDVWQLPPAKNLTKEELTGLEDTCTGLREAEIEMFLKGVKP